MNQYRKEVMSLKHSAAKKCNAIDSEYVSTISAFKAFKIYLKKQKEKASMCVPIVGYSGRVTLLIW